MLKNGYIVTYGDVDLFSRNFEGKLQFPDIAPELLRVMLAQVIEQLAVGVSFVKLVPLSPPVCVPYIPKTK